MSKKPHLWTDALDSAVATWAKGRWIVIERQSASKDWRRLVVVDLAGKGRAHAGRRFYHLAFNGERFAEADDFFAALDAGVPLDAIREMAMRPCEP
jgi:hypothetical protein